MGTALLLTLLAAVCPFPAPSLTAPANGGATVTTPVTFTWTAAEGALAYEVWASYDGGEFERLESTHETGLFDDVPPSTSVEWFVVAIFTTCSIRSATARFTTGACIPPSAQPIAPANGAIVGSPAAFSWSDVEDADVYRLWIDGRVEAETRHAEARVHLEPGAHAWFVETIFDDCGSSVSQTRALEVLRASSCTHAKPTLTTPAVNSRAVTLSWTPVAGAIGYEIRAGLGDGALEQVGKTTATSINTRLAAGRITWIVIARFDGCDDVASDASQFTILHDPSCGTTAPLPLAPANDADDVPTRVDFVWTAVADAKRYDVFLYEDEGEGEPILVGSTTSTRLTADVPEGELAWVVEAELENCPPVVSPMFVFDTAEPGPCRVPAAPEIFLYPRAQSGEEVRLLWSARLYASSYEVQEATRGDFSDATTRTMADILLALRHDVSETTRYFYRVRAQSSCGLGSGPWSEAASIVVTPTKTVANRVDLATPYGRQDPVAQTVRISGSNVARPFAATIDKSWLHVEPASGTIPPEGLELTITADPKNLPLGSNVGTLFVHTGLEARPPVPVSVSLVTPINPNAGNAPLPTSLIIPAVAHLDGIGAHFESDIRLANTSAQLMQYLLVFTPSGSNGARVGQQVTIQVGPGETAALNDVLKNVFGYANVSDNISGVLEIRPITNTTSASVTTFASSRTFASGAAGTYGQFIPAIPYARFIGQGSSVLSLQQVAQSAEYRTNVGLVEGSGQPATIRLSIFDDAGRSVGDVEVALDAGEHMHLGAFLAQHGLAIDDGRIEVAVTSSSGKVTAYASVLDNRTNDPMLILPVDPGDIAASRYILPGIAESAAWRSDVRVFNAAAEATTATFTYFPQGDPAGARTTTRTLAAGQVLAIDRALQTLFDVTNGGGSVVITTPADSQLAVTARTYTESDHGTYGQFISAVTVAEGVGAGERALQLLQVEESERYRTNVGLVELTGNAVTVEISAFTPDSKAAAVTRVDLQANEFRQIGGILRSFGFPTTYNARVTMKVVSGSGRISGYASLVDNGTNDGTYIPAQ